MDEKELDEQFQEMEGDTQVQTAAAGGLPAPPLKKRITVADLKKAIDGIQNIQLPEALEWLGQLDTRLDAIEKCVGILQHNQSELMKAHLIAREAVDTIQATPQTANIDTRLDNQDAAIGALASALRSHLEEPAAPALTPETELEFAQPPQQTAGGQSRKSDIEAVASVCLHMTDVLMICRVLKATPDLPDEDRTYLLTIACRAAGVTLSPGLQIRAGVREVEA